MFTAETEIEVSHGQTGRTFPVRFTYTVTKPRPASRTEPAEEAAVEITCLEICMFTTWTDADDCAHDIILEAFGDDEKLDAWLLNEAADQMQALADDAADHRRRLQQEGA